MRSLLPAELRTKDNEPGWNWETARDEYIRSAQRRALGPSTASLVRAAEGGDQVSRVFMFCYPSVLGYVFNPVSFWYGYRADGELIAILAEVSKPGRLVVVAENHSVVGGLGEAVAGLLLREGVVPAKFRMLGLPDAFLDAGALPTLHDRYGISAEKVTSSIKAWLA